MTDTAPPASQAAAGRGHARYRSVTPCYSRSFPPITVDDARVRWQEGRARLKAISATYYHHHRHHRTPNDHQQVGARHDIQLSDDHRHQQFPGVQRQDNDRGRKITTGRAGLQESHSTTGCVSARHRPAAGRATPQTPGRHRRRHSKLARPPRTAAERRISRAYHFRSSAQIYQATSSPSPARQQQKIQRPWLQCTPTRLIYHGRHHHNTSITSQRPHPARPTPCPTTARCTPAHARLFYVPTNITGIYTTSTIWMKSLASSALHRRAYIAARPAAAIATSFVRWCCRLQSRLYYHYRHQPLYDIHTHKKIPTYLDAQKDATKDGNGEKHHQHHDHHTSGMLPSTICAHLSPAQLTRRSDLLVSPTTRMHARPLPAAAATTITHFHRTHQQPSRCSGIFVHITAHPAVQQRLGLFSFSGHRPVTTTPHQQRKIIQKIRSAGEQNAAAPWRNQQPAGLPMSSRTEQAGSRYRPCLIALCHVKRPPSIYACNKITIHAMIQRWRSYRRCTVCPPAARRAPSRRSAVLQCKRSSSQASKITDVQNELAAAGSAPENGYMYHPQGGIWR